MNATTDISPTATRAAHELRVMVGRLRRRAREVSDSSELTPSQTSVISRLDKDGPATAASLAAAEGVRPQSMAATLGVLDERGMIRREPDPDDGRRQRILLTDEARDWMSGSRRQREEWLSRQIQDRCSEAERRLLVEALAIVDRVIRP
ncbi:MAG TPA: MarR family winged helix-turn-helix transcriptional regulator [Stackebrandtia sp.]|jgi:DNA-binding MarR family transcriptional regulator|uniref:MarR family winged helix-turn-helix transcriptional regulator n=1 Tax=Stackebrandtia sp. TaxID=2023065 RepID=UPI002D3C0306|nr:MarR family winged helix-turn-helix transcriptional regulator [Stackebrandtia sp.]HZE37502.1 MarR family winged helix-turn-helix transcriptional regulator [Stackebrandtia sp.]